MGFIKKFPNNGNVMIPIHGGTKKYGTDAYFQCRLFPLEYAKKELEKDDTNDWGGTAPVLLNLDLEMMGKSFIHDSIIKLIWNLLL